MLFIVDRKLGQVVAELRSNVPLSLGFQKPAMSSKGLQPVELVFVQFPSETGEYLGSSAEMKFTAKSKTDFTTTVLLESAFVWNATTLQYEATLNTNTTALNNLFTGSTAQVTLNAQVSFRLNSALNWTHLPPFDLLVNRNVAADNDSTPENASDPNDYRTAAAQDALTGRNDQAASFTTGQKDQLRKNIGLILTEQTLADAATIAWDMSLGYNAKVTLGGNRTLGAPTNAPFVGAEGFLTVLQDATGARTLALDAAFVPLAGAVEIDGAASAKTRFRWRYDGTNYLLWMVSSPFVQSLTDAANIAWNMSLGINAKVTLAGNRTLDNPTSKPAAGASGFLQITQDATGSRTLAFGSDFDEVHGAITLNATASDVTLLAWFYDGSKLRLFKP